MKDTPETDMQSSPYGDVKADFARKLERERNTLHDAHPPSCDKV